MKLFPLVFVVGFVQMCLGYSIGQRSSELIELNESNIERFRSDWKMVPGIKPGAVDNFVSIFENFRPNSSDNDIIKGIIQLLGLAINVDTSKINKTLIEQFSHKNKNEDESESDSEDAESTSPKGITDIDLKELETVLSRELTPAQTKHAIQIFRGFRQGATAQEKEAALVNLYTSALTGAFGQARTNIPTFEPTLNESSENNEL